MKIKKILIAIAIFLSAIFLSVVFIVKEPFATEEELLRKEINTVITIFNDTLCPVYKIIIDDYKTELGTIEAANEKLKNDVGGTVFVCPPPDNPLQLPADIDKQIQQTLNFFSKKLKSMKDSLLKTLNSCDTVETFRTNKYSYKTIEGFETTKNVCAPPLGQSKSSPPPPKQDCIQVSEIPVESVIPILKARAQVLSNLIKDKQIAETIAAVQADTSELLTAKKKAESGELRPNCPV